MLNLLFISDNPKAEHIKSALQPCLKVIIDVVTDFDHGLKDVFEKRPATVCIQDQIGGVTGESVARHIQMLLGSGSPAFILLHAGNGKARAIKGLYEHLVDMSQPEDLLAEDVKNTIKSLLGDQWEKIYIPPKLSPASIRSSVAVPEESREDADRLVDDFLSDLETSGFSVDDDVPSPFAPVAETVQAAPPITPGSADEGAPELTDSAYRQTSDEMADLLLAEVKKADQSEKGAVAPAKKRPAAAAGSESKPPSARTRSRATVSGADVSPLPPDVPSGKPPVTVAAVAPAVKEEMQAAAPPAQAEELSPPVKTAPAEFQISQETAPAEEHIPEDLLLAFEENYRSDAWISRRGAVIALVCVVSAAAVWYLFMQKPQLVSSLTQQVSPSTGTQQAPVAQVPLPAPSVPKPVPPPVQRASAAPQLPSFIPKGGHDAAYAPKHPGWERFVGKGVEFRLFSAAGRLKAVQVLAVKETPISDSLLTSVLKEVAGSPEYQVTSRNTKSGVLVENGIIADKGEVVVYRKNKDVKAFVVSVN